LDQIESLHGEKSLEGISQQPSVRKMNCVYRNLTLVPIFRFRERDKLMSKKFAVAEHRKMVKGEN
jgi:hypothetical protein